MPTQTRFVDTDAILVAQSFRPCHLFGDGDFYGKGVRYSFYIQYAVGIVALWYNVKDDITSIRLGLTVLSLALLVNLIVNSTKDGVVILDWAIVLQLVGFLPLYAIWRPVTHWILRRRTKRFRKEIRRARQQSRDAAQAEADALNERYRQVQSATMMLDEARRTNMEYERARDEYTNSVARFLQSASLGDQSSTAVAAYLATQHQTSMNHHDQLRNLYLGGLNQIYANIGVNEERRQYLTIQAEARVQEVAGMAPYEPAMNRLWREHKALWRHEKTSLGIVLAVWMAYVCATPWVFFKAVNKGRKQGCDVKLRTFPIFAPISIYNNSYVVYLRFSASFTLVVFGIVGAGIAIWLTVYGIDYRLNPPDPKQDVERPPETATNPNRIVIPSEQQTRESAEISHRSAEELRVLIYRGFAAPSCLFFLIITVVLVEETIKSNDIDLSGSPISSTSQLLPLLIAIFTSLSVIFHSVEEERNRERKYRESLRSFLEGLKGRFTRNQDGQNQDGQDGQTQTGQTLTGQNQSNQTQSGQNQNHRNQDNQLQRDGAEDNSNQQPHAQISSSRTTQPEDS